MEDNYLTTAGSLEHDRAHDYSESETRGSLLIMRDLRVSRRLGITGACMMWSSSGNRRLAYRCMDDPALGFLTPWNTNMVRPSRPDGIAFNFARRPCLEEMLACAIPEGALFCTNRPDTERVVSSFDESLQSNRHDDGEMHDLFARGHTPKVRPSKACRACSLRDVCSYRNWSGRVRRDSSLRKPCVK